MIEMILRIYLKNAIKYFITKMKNDSRILLWLQNSSTSIDSVIVTKTTGKRLLIWLIRPARI